METVSQKIIVVCSDTANTVAIYSSDGSEAYTEDIVYSGALARDIVIVDWDGDLASDILVSLNNPTTNPDNPIDVLLLTNNGTGGFDASPLITFTENTNGIDLYDVDSDGDLDIIMGIDAPRIDQPKLISIGINEGGEVNRIISLSELDGGTVVGMDIGDLNGDGKNEIVYADFERGNLVVTDFTISSSDTSGVTSILNTLSSGLSIYPNPTLNDLQIDLKNQNIYLESISVLNSHGQQILNEPVGRSKKIKIDLTSLSPGVYYLRMLTNLGEVVQRVLKQ